MNSNRKTTKRDRKQGTGVLEIVVSTVGVVLPVDLLVRKSLGTKWSNQGSVWTVPRMQSPSRIRNQSRLVGSKEKTARYGLM